MAVVAEAAVRCRLRLWLLTLLNCAIITLFMPESLPKSERRATKLNWREANPLGALQLLFARSPLLRGSSAAFCLIWLGNACINSIFGNYVNHLFGWGPTGA